jgi:hypothetical protein
MIKIILSLIFSFIAFNAMATTYTSQYPPAQNSTYVQATSTYTTNYPYFATDPSKSLTGTAANNSWNGQVFSYTNQRFHIDLGSAKTIKRIYYENFHESGSATDWGVKNFTFWGSNASGDFSDLVYADNGTWTQLTTAQTTFDQHVESNTTDPKYILVTNSTAYRYYAFKFANNYSGDALMGFRRTELQTEDGAVQSYDSVLGSSVWNNTVFK